MIHSGRYFHAPVPWMATLILFITINLGFITRYFYSLSTNLNRKEERHNEQINEKNIKQNIIRSKNKPSIKNNSDDIQYLSRFRAVHLGFTRIFWGVLIAHIIMSYAYSN